MDQPEDRHVRRANAYRLLADGFQWSREPPPDGQVALAELARGLYPECAPAAARMVDALAREVRDPGALEVAFAKLFVGPYELLAPPYGSVYLDGERRIMGPTTVAAIERYAQRGLARSETNRELPDHLAAELEFMYYLGFQFVKTGDAGYLRDQASFLADHLALWTPALAARVAAAAVSDYFAGLAELTSSFVQADLAWLRRADGH